MKIWVLNIEQLNTIFGEKKPKRELKIVVPDSAREEECDKCLSSFDRQTQTNAPPCTCIDYYNKESPRIVLRTMNECWNFCCKIHDEYYSAKFGEHTNVC
jgi:hypothetical protein